MSKDKYPSIFLPQMGAIVFIILQIVFSTRMVLKLGEYSRTFPSFSWGIFTCMMRLEQLYTSENIWRIIKLLIILLHTLCWSSCTYLLLTEFEFSAERYGPILFPFQYMAQAWCAQAVNWKSCNLQYGQRRPGYIDIIRSLLCVLWVQKMIYGQAELKGIHVTDACCKQNQSI